MWNRTKSVLVFTLVLVCIVGLSGCFRHNFTVGAGAPDGKEIYRHWHHHWIFGLVGEQNLDIATLCPSGNATIHEETTFLNGVIDVLIGIIYSPTTVTVRCDDGVTAEIELDEEVIDRIAADPIFAVMVAELVPERLGEVQVALNRWRRSATEVRLASASVEPSSPDIW